MAIFNSYVKLPEGICCVGDVIQIAERSQDANNMKLLSGDPVKAVGTQDMGSNAGSATGSILICGLFKYIYIYIIYILYILYHIISYHIILYYIILYCIILYYIILYCIILY